METIGFDQQVKYKDNLNEQKEKKKKLKQQKSVVDNSVGTQKGKQDKNDGDRDGGTDGGTDVSIRPNMGALFGDIKGNKKGKGGGHSSSIIVSIKKSGDSGSNNRSSSTKRSPSITLENRDFYNTPTLKNFKTYMTTILDKLGLSKPGIDIEQGKRKDVNTLKESEKTFYSTKLSDLTGTIKIFGISNKQLPYIKRAAMILKDMITPSRFSSKKQDLTPIASRLLLSEKEEIKTIFSNRLKLLFDEKYMDNMNYFLDEQIKRKINEYETSIKKAVGYKTDTQVLTETLQTL